MKYEKPEMIVIVLNEENIIRTSDGIYDTETPGGNTGTKFDPT